MKKKICQITLLSCSLIMGHCFSLDAAQSMITSPNSSEKENSSKQSKPSSSSSNTEVKRGGVQEGMLAQSTATQSTRKSEDTDDKGQMPAWMIESEQAAKDYVSTLDKGQYAQSWSKGDQIFQHTITQEEWVKALDASRKGLGNVQARELKLHRPAWNPHGLPKGPYMVIEYETAFSNSPQSIELLTLRRGTDGKWRVLTYQVK